MLPGNIVHPVTIPQTSLPEDSPDQVHASPLWWHGLNGLLDERKWPPWNMHLVSQLYVATLTAEEFVPATPPFRAALAYTGLLHQTATAP